jgi:hypothetical protein
VLVTKPTLYSTITKVHRRVRVATILIKTIH